MKERRERERERERGGELINRDDRGGGDATR